MWQSHFPGRSTRLPDNGSGDPEPAAYSAFEWGRIRLPLQLSLLPPRHLSIRIDQQHRRVPAASPRCFIPPSSSPESLTVIELFVPQHKKFGNGVR
ncbi:Uncharacterized protein HZ326_22831 [Fusarium oxysporum f. sp. albedinis]|nr:Uncharacterized protein HZ326_22831 [Fusarium oxysporum f. sp. albedinis]